ncbi:hypothetical protein BHM03_00008875 [Ensete ventricosum]|nr:hypothetical protein BHM03_00008875 [Ensete ventricosum]
MMVKRSYRPDMDPRSSLGIRPRFGRAGSSPGVRLDFAEGFGKIARNTSRDYRRKTVRLTTKNVGGCRITGVRSLIKLGATKPRVPYFQGAFSGLIASVGG